MPSPPSSAGTRREGRRVDARGRRCSRRCASWSRSPTRPRPVAPSSGAHTILETLKLALADRDAYFGDDGCARRRAALRRRIAAERRALIGEHASHEWRPGVDRRPRAVPAAAAHRRRMRSLCRARASRPCRAGGETRGDTCHIDVVDRWGNIVAVTPVRRLAAVLADDPGARVLPRHPAADDVARRRVAVGAAARARARARRSRRRSCCGTDGP